MIITKLQMLQTSLYAHIWIVPRGLSKPSAYRCVCRCSTKQPALNKTLLYVIRWLLLRFLHCCSSLQQNHMTAERQTRGGGVGVCVGGVQTDSKRTGEKEKRLPETERAGQRRKKVELKVFHFKYCGTTARNRCCNQNKPGATTVPGNEKDYRK